MILRALTVILALASSFGASASAAESYYLLVFGSQSHPKQLKYTHTWATFVHTVGEGADPNAYHVEHLTISWLPETLKVRVLAANGETGVNLDMEQSIQTMLSLQENITMWGPFVIAPEIYQRAAQQVARLESGTVQYRAISGPLELDISDCIHAVADVDPKFGRNNYPLIRIGKPASRHIARNIMSRSIYDQRLYDNRWLIPRLGLNRYPIEFVSPRETPYLLFIPRGRSVREAATIAVAGLNPCRAFGSGRE